MLLGHGLVHTAIAARRRVADDLDDDPDVRGLYLVLVLESTGTTAIRMIFEASKIPNHKINSGTQAMEPQAQASLAGSDR